MQKEEALGGPFVFLLLAPLPPAGPVPVPCLAHPGRKGEWCLIFLAGRMASPAFLLFPLVGVASSNLSPTLQAAGSSHTHTTPSLGHILTGYDGKGANRKLGSVPGFGFGLCVFKQRRDIF